MNDIMDEIKLGWTDEAKQIALDYMKSNGYKLTLNGKNQALADLKSLDPQPKYSVALQTAIILLQVEQGDNHD